MKTKVCPQCGLMICYKEVKDWRHFTCGNCGWYSVNSEVCRKSKGFLLEQKSYEDACPDFEPRDIPEEAPDDN